MLLLMIGSVLVLVVVLALVVGVCLSVTFFVGVHDVRGNFVIVELVMPRGLALHR